MDLDLTGKLAVVTGAGHGIGRATAREFAAHGAHVVVVDLDREAGAAVVAEIARQGGRAEFASVDVTDEASVVAFFADLSCRSKHIDILVNGVGGGKPAKALEITADEWDRMFAFNARSTFLCIREAARYMSRGGGGRVVNVTSLAGVKTSVLQGAHYSASKAAAIGLTRHMALELAPLGINVNAIAPGTTATDRIEQQMTPQKRQSVLSRIPLGRLATPEDQAGAILFLVSELSSYITGITIDVSGGHLLA